MLRSGRFRSWRGSCSQNRPVHEGWAVFASRNPDAPEIFDLNDDVLDYTEGSGPQVLDDSAALATFSDADTTDFTGGKLTVTVAGALAEDSLSLQSGGNVTFAAPAAMPIVLRTARSGRESV